MSYSCSPEITNAAIDKAVEDGQVVVGSKPDLLLLDLDGPLAVSIYEARLKRLGNNLGAIEIDRWQSKTPGNMHVVVKLDRPVSALGRIALQACLGSDHTREFLAVLLVMQGLPEPSSLFKPKSEQ
ncbi:hypothetical protein LCGC14_0424780 [marine sediment metagenome]|uniref:Uncharacterized protein n=1 Tax=marine sediment metagenome TaxID=412755 RepID=A0A0F9VBX2_9ZZZZ